MDTAVDVAAAADLHRGEVAGYGGGGLYRWSDGGFHVVTSEYDPLAIVQVYGTQPGGFGRPRAGMELFGSFGERRAVYLPIGEETCEGHHWSGAPAYEQFPGHQHRIGRSTAWWTKIRVGDVELGGHPGRDGPTLRAERNTQIAAGQIGGRSYSLDEIEHEILRPMGEPRIHGAIVCASISCPSLLRTPYRAGSVGAQMDESLRAWMRHPDKGMALDRENRVLRVSKVFDWFSEDFEAAGGIRPFVTRYAPPKESAWLKGDKEPVSIRYFDYNWNLND